MIKKGDVVWVRAITSEGQMESSGVNTIEVEIETATGILFLLIDKKFITKDSPNEKKSFTPDGTVIIPFQEKIDSVTVKYK